ncbi:MAG: class I SAM-dependent methyltransferase [Prolixibacteraceae bacterium]|nr:class I SAM-dependent methyltransferase [Prolixibacteraceae bacterium]
MKEFYKCRICGNSYRPAISFGEMPIANGFLTKDQFDKEYFFELGAGFCTKCRMFQIIEQPDREMMFNDRYAFFSGTSKAMTQHFYEFFVEVKNSFLTSGNSFVVEIGSNDGIMLRNFAKSGVRHVGIEPSGNVADVARSNGINTISEFFDKELAQRVLNEHGMADAILGANVMCHIPYLHSIIEGMKLLLKPRGVIIFEDPYIGDVIENTTYDQIYDEHVFLFSVSSIQCLFDMYGMEVFDVEHQETHGGSMRYMIARRGTKSVSRRVREQLEREKILGLDSLETYEKFRNNCEMSRKKLRALVEDIKKEGRRIIGYAATSKSTTIINYCGFTTEHIEYICDTTPIKQGKFSPGAHIPVLPYEKFTENYPDYALLFAYNHEKEIMAKEKKFMESGGKWIVYVPEIKTL